MKNLLIMNMTRMGDLIQSTPLISGLRKKYPDARFTMVVSSDFEKFASRIPHIDEILVFNLRQFNIRNSQGKLKSWIEVYRYLEEFLGVIENKRYDGVFNLSHSKLSAMMLAWLKIPYVWGFFCNDTGDRMTFHPWMQYFGIEPFNRTFNAFNLSDIYLQAGDIEPSGNQLEIRTEPGDLTAANDLLSREGISGNDSLIAFQAGSSLQGRRWSVDSFARLGGLLSKNLGSKIVLLGVEGERNVAEEIVSRMENRDRVVNLAGKTGFPELIGVLQRCSYLVTNDTGTMHLAAALKIPIVGLFFAHAHPIETGPYGEGHLIFQARIPCAPCSYGVACNDIVCVRKVDPEDVFRFMQERHKNGIWSAPEDLKAPDGMNAYLTGFDPGNFLEMWPLIKRPITAHDVFRMAYRQMWRDSLSAKAEMKFDDVSGLEQMEETLRRRYDLSDIHAEMDEIRTRFGLLRQLAEWGAGGARIAAQIREGMAKGFRRHREVDKLGAVISELDERINQLGLSHLEFKPVADIFSKRKENLYGEDVGLLSTETIKCYRKLVWESSRLLFILNRISSALSSKDESFSTWTEEENALTRNS